MLNISFFQILVVIIILFLLFGDFSRVTHNLKKLRESFSNFLNKRKEK